MHAAELLLSESSSLEVEIAIKNLRSYKSQGIDQIPAEVVQAEGNTLHSEICKPTNSVLNIELPQQWKESVIIRIYKKGDKIDCKNTAYRGLSLLPTT